MSGTSYPPTDCTAVLSAMGSLTAEFGMGSGDPPLHGSAHAGHWPCREAIPLSTGGYPGGCIAFLMNVFLTTNREDEIEMKSSAD